MLIPLKFRVDIFSEFNRVCNSNYELTVFDQSIDELRNIISRQSGINKKAAQFALKLIKLKNIGIINSEQKDVDSLILDSSNKNTIIATQDIALKKKLLKKGSSVIILRQKKYLQLIEGKLYK